MPSDENPFTINERNKQNKIMIKQIFTGCFIIWIDNDIFVNNKINRKTPTTHPKTKNLMANVGSEVEKEITRGIIAINIWRILFIKVMPINLLIYKK